MIPAKNMEEIRVLIRWSKRFQMLGFLDVQFSNFWDIKISYL